MTNTEAIKILDGIEEVHGVLPEDGNEVEEALNMAIKALSYDDAKYHKEHGEVVVDKAVWEDAKKALEPCEDAISREATLKTYNGLNDEDTISVWLIRKNIEQQPSVKPQEKIGHWIDDGFYAEGHSHKAFHCSKCGHNVLGFKEDLSNYCPNCGAKMIEPQESEEV